MKQALEKMRGQEVVVDTRSSWVYIGTLAELFDHALLLKEADVHDNSDILTTKEQYVLATRHSGIKSNRDAVMINQDFIVSVSLLSDIKQF